jgi:hypothetical protein
MMDGPEAAPLPAPLAVAVPGPGRYLVRVDEKKLTEATVKNTNHCSIIDAEAAYKLRTDVYQMRLALAELHKRMMILSGDADIDVVAEPLELGFTWM